VAAGRVLSAVAKTTPGDTAILGLGTPSQKSASSPSIPMDIIPWPRQSAVRTFIAVVLPAFFEHPEKEIEYASILRSFASISTNGDVI